MSEITSVNMNKVKKAYQKGDNIIQFLHDNYVEAFDGEFSQIAYDMQSGVYTKKYNENTDNCRVIYENYAKELADKICQLGNAKSICEVGVGEATLLTSLINQMDKSPEHIFGFDISFSRLLFAQENFSENCNKKGMFFLGNLLEIPLLDNSIDIIYSSHSLEPNGGNEIKILQELYRVARKYIILIEPDYELNDQEGKNRMISHGYIQNLYQRSKELKYNVCLHEKFPYYFNPLNKPSIIIIEKKCESQKLDDLEKKSIFACPQTTSELSLYNNFYYSNHSSYIYPILKDIPCLLSSNGVLSSHLIHF